MTPALTCRKGPIRWGPSLLSPPNAHISLQVSPTHEEGREKMKMIKVAGSAPSFQKKNDRLALPDAFTTPSTAV